MSEFPVRVQSQYGSARYLVAPGVESPVEYHAEDLADLPALPTVAGFYILSSERDRWVPTDGLTYRTWSATICVRSTTEA